MKWLEDMDSENKTWIISIALVCSVAIVGFICLCVNCTVTEMYNPNPYKWEKSTPTVKARLVPIHE